MFVSSVVEAMAESGRGGCCNFCITFIVTSGFTALFLWLSLRASKPTCSIQDFYVPALIANSSSNHSIYIHLKLHNQNKDKGVYYDTLNLTLYYASHPNISVGNFTISSFYQGHNKNTHRKKLVDTYSVPWEAVSKAVLNGSKAVFRVDLLTAVRYKIVGFKTKRHTIRVGSQVEVDDSGRKIKKKGIKLKSGAPELQSYCANLPFLFIFLTTIFFFFII